MDGGGDAAIALLRPGFDETAVAARWAQHVVADVPLPPVAGSRLARLRDAARRTSAAAPAAELERLVAQVRPSAALTWGPWLGDELTPLWTLIRTVHVAEEDLSRMPEIAPQSAQAKAMRRLERRLRRFRSASPAIVAVIGEAEVAPARRRWGAPVEVLPHTLDPVAWPLAATPSEGDHVLVVGALHQPRNAEGLRALLDELGSDGPPFRLVSDGGVHDCLRPCVDGARVQVVPGDDVAGRYRSSRLVVVPAARATGLKTTILQAWSGGAAVATYAASAATLGRNRGAVAEASDASGLGAEVRRLWADDAARRRLARRGMDALRVDHDDSAAKAKLRSLVACVEAAPSRATAAARR